MALVQKAVVHKKAAASPLLPMHIALENEDGTEFSVEAPSAATVEKAGLVKKASATAAVTAADATAAAGETVTVEEFNKLVALANANKKALNDLISKSKSAGQMA